MLSRIFYYVIIIFYCYVIITYLLLRNNFQWPSRCYRLRSFASFGHCRSGSATSNHHNFSLCCFIHYPSSWWIYLSSRQMAQNICFKVRLELRNINWYYVISKVSESMICVGLIHGPNSQNYGLD